MNRSGHGINGERAGCFSPSHRSKSGIKSPPARLHHQLDLRELLRRASREPGGPGVAGPPTRVDYDVIVPERSAPDFEIASCSFW
jgi:hypothetical protein